MQSKLAKEQNLFVQAYGRKYKKIIKINLKILKNEISICEEPLTHQMITIKF